MSALTDYGSLADFNPQWFVAVPTASGRDCLTALKAQPPTFSGSDRNRNLGVCMLDVPVKRVWGVL